MKDTKYTLSKFSSGQMAAQTYLEKMAAQGWMIEKMGQYFWTFKRIEPQKLRFAITYFPGASEFDPHPSEGQLMKEDFCAQEGWQLALRLGVMQLFYTADENAVPIETDPVAQVENIYRAGKKGLWSSTLLMVFLCGWYIYRAIRSLMRDPLDFLSDPIEIFLVPIWILLLASLVYTMLSFFWWHKKARRAAEENGVFLPMKGQGSWLWMLLPLMALLFARNGIGGILIVMLVTTWAASWSAEGSLAAMKRKGHGRALNAAVSVGASTVVTLFVLVMAFFFVGMTGMLSGPDDSQPVGTYMYNDRPQSIYADPMPLTLEDLGITEGEYNRKARLQESILVEEGDYCQRPLLTETVQRPELNYTVWDFEWDALYELGKRGAMKLDEVDIEHFEAEFRPLDAAEYGCTELYQKYILGESRDHYVACWPGRIVELDYFGDFTQQQVKTAIQTLAP